MQEYLASEYIVRLPLIPQKLIYDTNISNELAISVALSSNPNEYYYKLVFEIFKIDKLSKLFILEFLSRLQYEKPQFQKSFLIPYSFIVILNYLIDNHSIFGTKEVDDFEDKIIGIIDLFKKDANIKRSFLHFSEFISINNKVYNNKTPLKILEIDKKIEEFSDDDEQYYIDWNSRFYITSRIFDIFK